MILSIGIDFETESGETMIKDERFGTVELIRATVSAPALVIFDRLRSMILRLMINRSKQRV
jgi:hypothetical protein